MYRTTKRAVAVIMTGAVVVVLNSASVQAQSGQNLGASIPYARQNNPTNNNASSQVMTSGAPMPVSRDTKPVNNYGNTSSGLAMPGAPMKLELDTKPVNKRSKNNKEATFGAPMKISRNTKPVNNFSGNNAVAVAPTIAKPQLDLFANPSPMGNLAGNSRNTIDPSAAQNQWWSNPNAAPKALDNSSLSAELAKLFQQTNTTPTDATPANTPKPTRTNTKKINNSTRK